MSNKFSSLFRLTPTDLILGILAVVLIAGYLIYYKADQDSIDLKEQWFNGYANVSLLADESSLAIDTEKLVNFDFGEVRQYAEYEDARQGHLDGFAIEVGVYEDQDIARGVLVFLSQKDQPVYTRHLQKEEGSFNYGVYVGPYLDYDEAIDHKQQVANILSRDDIRLVNYRPHR